MISGLRRHQLFAALLNRRTVLVRIARRAQSDVVDESGRDLLAHAAVIGLEAEAPEHRLALAFVPDAIDLPANAGDRRTRGQLHDRIFGYRFQQTEPDQRRCHAHCDHRVVA